ncbi:hypothetical protein KCG48_10655 [Proteiniclasticum sp. BAD-10]|uniref:Uncharacterized protein n=1 Tax=Proteiniclasticum sediminis TaxID=2804028 RepID=A0A941HRN4_9CLOT|nr:hypothetical protein [Proteiniclasticum sediminis]MBR0576793.1 hypothetical protein [Proteiniclasticum sediminis]
MKIRREEYLEQLPARSLSREVRAMRMSTQEEFEIWLDEIIEIPDEAFDKEGNLIGKAIH